MEIFRHFLVKKTSAYFNDKTRHHNEKVFYYRVGQLSLKYKIKKIKAMKTRNLILVLVLTLFFSGCVVYSFYPLYTEKDLFPNELLTGSWIDEDETKWEFKHPVHGKKELKVVDSLRYVLTVSEDEASAEFIVHVVELGGHYFLDFYMEEYFSEDDMELTAMHIIPVHTFAKLEVSENSLTIRWFDPEWMEDLIKENKIRIHHEENDDFILLTAKPKELQKFVTKYVNSEEAFNDGLSAILTRLK